MWRLSLRTQWRTGSSNPAATVRNFDGPNTKNIISSHATGWGTGIDLVTGTEYVASLSEQITQFAFNGLFDGTGDTRNWKYQLNFVSKGGNAPGFKFVLDLFARTITPNGQLVREMSGVTFACTGA